MPLTRMFALCALLSASQALPGQAADSLRQAAGDGLLIGCPVGIADLDDPPLLDLIVREFNTITIETELMTFKLGADRDELAFAPADRVLAWAQRHDLPVFGHMLLWDYRVPDWMFADGNGDPLPREEGIARLREYIHKVVTRYKGQLAGWNVVNEALSDEPGVYLRDTAALRSIGPDYVQLAFAFAHEADPETPLYYNDYNLVVPEKREKALRLVRELKAAGVRLDAIGVQGHWLLSFPDPDWIEQTLDAFANEGLDIYVTELDVDVLPRTVTGANMQTVDHGPDPYRDGFPDSAQRDLADAYARYFHAILRQPRVKMITFWGSHDGRSWLNNFPVTGRTNYPLLFDRQLKRKPAYHAVLKELAQRPQPLK